MTGAYCGSCQASCLRDDAKCAACGQARPARGWPRDLLLGMTLGERYRVQRRLDQNPLGVIYAAIDLETQARVNLRTLHSRHHADDAMLARFRRQLDIVQRLGDEATARVLGMLEEPGLIGYVTETLDGTLERDLGEDMRLSMERAVDVAHQIALSLAEAHAKGIVHRDLQPANVLTGSGGQVKVLGYGLSAVQEVSRDSIARGVRRSPGYIAPEQVQRQDPDPRMDLYAVGSLLFRMLVGRLPYPDPDPMVILREKVNKPAPPIGDLLPGAPKRLANLVDGLLAIDPQQRRPATSAELVASLDAVRRQLGGDTMVPRRASSPFTRAQPARRRNALVTVAWGGAIGLFIGVALALVQALVDSPEPAPPPQPAERAAPVAPPAAPSPDRLPASPPPEDEAVP